MHATITIKQGFTVTVDAANEKELFARVSSVQQMFYSEPCGLCGCADVSWRYRQTKQGFEYYEVVCTACGAALQLSFRTDGGGAYPRRRNYSTGAAIGTNGWVLRSDLPEPEQATAPPSSGSGGEDWKNWAYTVLPKAEIASAVEAYGKDAVVAFLKETYETRRAQFEAMSREERCAALAAIGPEPDFLG